MSTSIHVGGVSFLVVLVIVCFNSSTPTFADSDLFISISNDMPLDQPGVFFIYNLTEAHIPSVQGHPWTITTDLTVKYLLIFWDVLCANFDLYDPSKDGRNGKAYWSVRTDGMYHSYDNKNWEKRVAWKVRGYLGSCD